MAADLLKRQFGAKEIVDGESAGLRWLVDLAKIWGAQDSGHESGNRVEEAEGVLEEIRLAYRNFSAKKQVQESTRKNDAETTATTKTVRVSGGSLEDQELSRLKRYLGPEGVHDFLDGLFDDQHDQRQAFSSECEILWHRFSNDTSFSWVRAEYVRIKRYLENTGTRPVVITGHPGIGIGFRPTMRCR